MKKLLILVALIATACGSGDSVEPVRTLDGDQFTVNWAGSALQLDSTGAPVLQDAQEVPWLNVTAEDVSEPNDGDQEVLKYTSGFVVSGRHGIDTGVTQCPLQGSGSTHTCIIPDDKSMRFKYVGPADDTPGWTISAKAAFATAVGNFCTDAANWPICGVSTLSSAKETITVGDAGVSNPGEINNYGAGGPTVCGQDAQHWQTGAPVYALCHNASAIIDKAEIVAAGFPTGQGQIALINVMYHEIMHMAGFGHTTTSGDIMRVSLVSSTSVVRASFSEGQSLTFFNPLLGP